MVRLYADENFPSRLLRDCGNEGTTCRPSRTRGKASKSSLTKLCWPVSVLMVGLW